MSLIDGCVCGCFHYPIANNVALLDQVIDYIVCIAHRNSLVPTMAGLILKECYHADIKLALSLGWRFFLLCWDSVYGLHEPCVSRAVVDTLGASMRVHYLEAMMKSEGFTPKAKWDYAQHSNGYGTRARSPDEVIDVVEGRRRFASEVAIARAAVERFAPGLDEGTAAALTSLTYNAGAGWMRAGLGAAVACGDLEAVRRLFVQYVHAGGQRLPGLELRRSLEVQWIGQAQAETPGGAKDVERVGVDGGSVEVSGREPPVRSGSSMVREQAALAAPLGHGEPNLRVRVGGDDLLQAFNIETIATILSVVAGRRTCYREEFDLTRRMQMAGLSQVDGDKSDRD